MNFPTYALAALVAILIARVLVSNVEGAERYF